LGRTPDADPAHSSRRALPRHLSRYAGVVRDQRGGPRSSRPRHLSRRRTALPHRCPRSPHGLERAGSAPRLQAGSRPQRAPLRVLRAQLLRAREPTRQRYLHLRAPLHRGARKRQRLRSPVPPREIRRRRPENRAELFGDGMRQDSAQRRDAENAEEAQRTHRRAGIKVALVAAPSLLLAWFWFSLLFSLRSLRLCVEKTPSLANTPAERSPC